MPDDEKRVISSSGRHIFVSFIIGIYNSRPGFISKIHHGKEINNIKIMHQKHTV